MNTILGVISASLGILIFLLATHRSFHRLGYHKSQREGFQTGYLRDWKDESNWWIGVESETAQIREKIWREEAQL